jgi:hypothetical protein
MDPKKIKKKSRKTIIMNIRITPEISKWLKEKEYSPTAIFYEALKELGYKE